jgi:DNA-binding MarR family transcriptional regulator
LGYQVNLLARLFESALRARIAPYGVVPGQFAQLLALFERDGVSQADLCKAVHIDQSTMALTLRRMERDGLITRVASQQDKRRTEIWLTSRARELRATLVACAQDGNAVATQGVSEVDLGTTRRVLSQMIQNLQADTSPTRP